MKNVKSEVYKALCSVTENVTDLYPPKTVELPAIQYAEEQNAVKERVANEEYTSEVRYRIDIYNDGSTSDLAVKVDDAIAKLGLVRIFCADVPEQSQIRHKQMRYEGLIDMQSDIVYK